MKMNAAGFAATLLAAAMTMSLAHAQQAAPAKGAAQAKAKIKTGPGAVGVERLRAAATLVRYGDEMKDPMALITAAKIIKEVGESKWEGQRAGGNGAAKNKPVDTVESILARAKALAPGRQDVVAMADDVAKGSSRGAEGGPKVGTFLVSRGESDTLRVRFRGGEMGRVLVQGDGDSDLDLFVYDSNGRLVCKDDDGTDQMYCSFPVYEDGTYRIRVQNLGMANQYRVRTN